MLIAPNVKPTASRQFLFKQITQKVVQQMQPVGFNLIYPLVCQLTAP